VAELRAHVVRLRRSLHNGAERAAEGHAQRLANAHDRLRRAPLLALERRQASVATLHARLEALSPLATLERGYAIVHRGDELVRSAAQVAPGDAVEVRVAEGTFGAKVD
jgi:exodeoxyribonuclease VII large subunit